MEILISYILSAFIKQSIKLVEKDGLFIYVLYVTKKTIKVKKILIPKVIPSTGIQVMRLRGRTIGVRLYFSQFYSLTNRVSGSF